MFFLNIFQRSGFSNFPGDLSSMSVSWIFYLNIGGGFRSLSNFVRETKSVRRIIFLSTLFSQRDIRSFLSVQLFRILGSTRPLDPSVEFVLRTSLSDARCQICTFLPCHHHPHNVTVLLLLVLLVLVLVLLVTKTVKCRYLGKCYHRSAGVKTTGKNLTKYLTK